MLHRTNVRTAARCAPAIALTLALPVAGLAGTTPAWAAATPKATINAPWVKTKAVTGKDAPVVVTVKLSGEGPFTWTGYGSVEAGVYGDVGFFEPPTGSAPLAAGTHRIEVATTSFYRLPGRQHLSLTFTDAAGAEVDVSTTVHVVDKANRPRVTAASGPASAAKKRVLRGKARGVGPMKAPYRIYFRAPGEKKFTPIGRVTPNQNDAWTFRSTRVLPGTYMVKTESKYLTTTTSKKFTVKASAFTG